jgi:hypothetical protein
MENMNEKPKDNCLGNIKICFQETACEGVDWIKLAQGMHHS